MAAAISVVVALVAVLFLFYKRSNTASSTVEPIPPDDTTPSTDDSAGGDLPTQDQSTDFYDKVDTISAQLGIADSGWLLAAMDFESGLDPSRVSTISGATGLIQFMPPTAARLGTTVGQLASMDAIAQLDYVYRYLSPYAGKLNNLGDVYMSILWPAAVGKLDSFILFQSPSIQYRQNSGLDATGKGYVTRGDAAARVNRIYQAKYTQPAQGTNA